MSVVSYVICDELIQADLSESELNNKKRVMREGLIHLCLNDLLNKGIIEKKQNGKYTGIIARIQEHYKKLKVEVDRLREEETDTGEDFVHDAAKTDRELKDFRDSKW